MYLNMVKYDYTIILLIANYLTKQCNNMVGDLGDILNVDGVSVLRNSVFVYFGYHFVSHAHKFSFIICQLDDTRRLCLFVC